MNDQVHGADVIDCLRSLSIVLDLANGMNDDKSLRTALFAYELAERASAPDAVRAQAFFSALLRHLGCTSYAVEEAELVEDDIVLRRELARSDSSVPAEVAQALITASPHIDPRPTLARLAASGAEIRRTWTHEACGGARALAGALGADDAVQRALAEVFERYDGRGAPDGLQGEAISLVARIANVAHLSVVQHLTRGLEVARATLRRNIDSEGACDPLLSRYALELLDEHEPRVEHNVDERLERIRGILCAHAPKGDAFKISEAFGDFSDLQSRYTRAHARGVAALAEGAGIALGLSRSEQTTLSIAAHLHDVGAAAVPTRIWETRDAWSVGQRERARMHVYYTDRVLALAAPLSAARPIASAHHERLDATGYHRGLSSERISESARILAVSDVFHGLLEARPHRPARSRADAVEVVRELAASGALDRRAVDAVLARKTCRSQPRMDGIARPTLRQPWREPANDQSDDREDREHVTRAEAPLSKDE